MARMDNESRIEYAVRGTVARHGKHVETTEIAPGHEADKEWNRRLAEERREWQANAGITPDAVLVVRVWTATGWISA